MKALFAILTALTSLASAQEPSRPPVLIEQSGSVTRARLEGSLQPTVHIGCIDLAEATAELTPPDLHTGFSKCVAQGEFEKSARLFLLAGIFARFDAERVSDRTARGGGQVLIVNTTAQLTPEQREGFTRAALRLQKDPEALRALCVAVQRVGPPSYFPRYLVLHGLNAFTSPNPMQGALVPDFDPVSKWAQLQDAYLHCPR